MLFCQTYKTIQLSVKQCKGILKQQTNKAVSPRNSKQTNHVGGKSINLTIVSYCLLLVSFILYAVPTLPYV